jgi:hypothetical protein
MGLVLANSAGRRRNPRLEVNIPDDRSSIAYRQGLRSLGLSHFFPA